ncbi:Transposable element Tcb2 transposase [Araneus ventricosus]|uniref:Transposable element Tcb2 transposase n=1 Tax=Araneus ventricosus TaxID=182803 RepID=A0A4Y2E8S8_ARAVE|nr:Transposable element Tcb2 transposase [Araneus ventricosus]
MVWGCISDAGVGSLCFIERYMNEYMYLSILKQNVLSSAEKIFLGQTTFTFQQDNDPKLTSKICQEWCLYHAKQQLHSPPQSPDLNTIEYLWEEIGRELRKYDIKNKVELLSAIQDSWSNISPETTTKKTLGSQTTTFERSYKDHRRTHRPLK